LGSAFKKFINRFNPIRETLHSHKIFISAFGKHPGWDDHIDDIGLATNIFIRVKRLLYIRGIGGNVDKGSWDKLQKDQLIEEFKHVFFWFIEGHLVVGRMWSSQDGKGRKSYPFVVCVQCQKLPIQWIFENVLPQLERIEATCKATTSATEVRRAVQNAGQELLKLARQCGNSQSSIIQYPDALLKLAKYPEMGPDHEGLFRILYHIDREVGRHYNHHASSEAIRSTSLRVPAGSTRLQNILLWSSFLLDRFGTDTSVLILIPLGSSWMDIIIGEPTEIQLYCLRTSPKVIPLTSSIPYNMSSEEMDQAKRQIGDCYSRTHNPGKIVQE